MRHGAWRNTDSECHDEHNGGFGHHDELLLKSAQYQEALRHGSGPRALSPTAAPLPNLMTLRCNRKSLCDELHK
jgi:hypothetical protein